MNSAHSYEELVIWQLGSELRDSIFELTEHGPASRDFEFRKQIRSASSSVPSNIAEGFGYYKPKLFARHLRIAIASLDETKGHLQDGAGTKGYFDPNQAGRLDSSHLPNAASVETSLRYLDSCKGNAPVDWAVQTSAKTSGPATRKPRSEPREPRREPSCEPPFEPSCEPSCEPSS